MLSVQPRSPAADTIVFPTVEAARDGLRAPLHAPLVSFLDFIISINGDVLEADSSWFGEELRENKDKPVILEVYNYKSGRTRTVQVVPREGWGGEGLLGLHVRWDSIATAAESVLHVTDVAPGSPAAAAGLVPGDDWVLGAPEGSFQSVRQRMRRMAHRLRRARWSGLRMSVAPTSTLARRRLTYLEITLRIAPVGTQVSMCCVLVQVRVLFSLRGRAACSFSCFTSTCVATATLVTC